MAKDRGELEKLKVLGNYNSNSNSKSAQVYEPLTNPLINSNAICLPYLLTKNFLTYVIAKDDNTLAASGEGIKATLFFLSR